MVEAVTKRFVVVTLLKVAEELLIVTPLITPPVIVEEVERKLLATNWPLALIVEVAIPRLIVEVLTAK